MCGFSSLSLLIVQDGYRSSHHCIPVLDRAKDERIKQCKLYFKDIARKLHTPLLLVVLWRELSSMATLKCQETEKYNVYSGQPRTQLRIKDSIIEDKKEKSHLVITIDLCQMCHLCTYKTSTIIM